MNNDFTKAMAFRMAFRHACKLKEPYVQEIGNAKYLFVFIDLSEDGLDTDHG